ncbi:phage holin [Lactococcus lactis]|jgi:holin, SPP1 family|uniref:Phage holin n=1 Tax=Lactococcus lactis subsp. lactis TaxID=1360 RepID=A0A0V8CZV2_LACLL|nr:phage holin [Lactococcus lactis]KSU06836.1 Phage holin [Lactococcus lactis subsp. lactis]
MNNKGPDIGTITRTVILVLALINQILTTLGYSPLPIHDSQVQDLLSIGITMVVSVMTWWKNNSFTHSAKIGDEAMKASKSQKNE